MNIAFNFTSSSGVIDRSGDIKANGFGSYAIVPVGAVSSFTDRFDEYWNGSYETEYTSITETAVAVDNLRDEVSTVLNGYTTTTQLAEYVNGNVGAAVTEQFGSYVSNSTAASMYNLSVNANGHIAGFELGALGGDAKGSSYIKVNATNFLVYADDGTTHTDAGAIDIPTFAVGVNPTTGKTQVNFNGVVAFENLANNSGVTLIDGGKIDTEYLVVSEILAEEITAANITGGTITGTHGEFTLTDAYDSAQYALVGDGGTDSGVYGKTTAGAGVYGYATTGTALWGYASDGGIGAQALAIGVGALGLNVFSAGKGITVESTDNGIEVLSSVGKGIVASSVGDHGGYFTTDSTAGTAAGVAGFANNTYGVSATGKRGILAIGNDGIGVNAFSTSGDIAVYGSSSGVGVAGATSNTSGEWGLYTSDKAKIGGAVYPFTGAHIGFSTDTSIVLGDIVATVATKAIDISQSYVELISTVSLMDKRVYGVCSQVTNDIEEYVKTDSYFNVVTRDADGSEVYTPIEEYIPYTTKLLVEKYKRVSINALGEGMMNVCDANGDIENGDYICSSGVSGKGMKQGDDLLHNYTVAKSLEDVVWDNEVAGENGCYEVDGHKVKMVGCTYHCG